MGLYKSPAEFEAIIQDLRTQVAVLQRTKVTHGSGVPPTGFKEPYVDDTNSRLYYYVNGVAKSVLLA